MIKECFFCNKIIIPLNLLTTNEIKEYFFKEGIAYTLNYTKSKNKIGNKDICFICLKELKEITNQNVFEMIGHECNHDCENCS